MPTVVWATYGADQRPWVQSLVRDMSGRGLLVVDFDRGLDPERFDTFVEFAERASPVPPRAWMGALALAAAVGVVALGSGASAAVVLASVVAAWAALWIAAKAVKRRFVRAQCERAVEQARTVAPPERSTTVLSWVPRGRVPYVLARLGVVNPIGRGIADTVV